MSRKNNNFHLKRSLEQQQADEMMENAQYPGAYPFPMDNVFDDAVTTQQQMARLSSAGGHDFQHTASVAAYGNIGGESEGSASKRSRLNPHDAASASAAAISAAISQQDAFAPNPLPNHHFARGNQLGGPSPNFGGAGGVGDAEEMESLQRLQLLKMQNAAMQNRLMAAANNTRNKRAAASAMMDGMGGGNSFLHPSSLQPNPFAQTALSSIYASQRTAASLSAATQAAQLSGNSGAGSRADVANDPFLSSALSGGQASGFFGMHDTAGNDFDGMAQRRFSNGGMGGMAGMAQRRFSNNGIGGMSGMAQRRFSNGGMGGMPGMAGMAQRRLSNEMNPMQMQALLGQQGHMGPSALLGMGAAAGASGNMYFNRQDPFSDNLRDPNSHSPTSSAGDSIPDVSAQLKKLKRKQASNREQLRSTAAAPGSVLRKFDGKWGERLEQLIQYKKENGDCLVPDGFAANPKLARWVREQRGQFKNLRDGKPSHMTQERMAALNELNFTWSLREKVDWKDRFEELVDYKCKHGDCLVPTNYAPNAQLGTWVANQRKHYRLMKEEKRSIMTPDRVKYLEKIGFQWSIRPSGSRKAKS
jgi:hypothetical protein